MNKLTIKAEPGQPTIISERMFNTSPEKLFDAHINVDKLPRWWSAGGKYPMTVERFDPKNGGSWRFLTTDENGENHANFHGVYHEVTPNERIISTWEFEGLPEPGHVILEAATFTDQGDGTTKLTVVQSFLTVADRDGMVASGMSEGSNASYEALAKLVGSE